MPFEKNHIDVKTICDGLITAGQGMARTNHLPTGVDILSVGDSGYQKACHIIEVMQENDIPVSGHKVLPSISEKECCRMAADYVSDLSRACLFLAIPASKSYTALFRACLPVIPAYADAGCAGTAARGRLFGPEEQLIAYPVLAGAVLALVEQVHGTDLAWCTAYVHDGITGWEKGLRLGLSPALDMLLTGRGASVASIPLTTGRDTAIYQESYADIVAVHAASEDFLGNSNNALGTLSTGKTLIDVTESIHGIPEQWHDWAGAWSDGNDMPALIDAIRVRNAGACLMAHARHVWLLHKNDRRDHMKSAIGLFPEGSKKRDALEQFAAKINALNGSIEVYVDDAYFDYGQGLQWTTLIAHRKGLPARSALNRWQPLSPKDQMAVLDGTDQAFLDSLAAKIAR